MPSEKDIMELGMNIAKEFQPEKIILFGSHAGGKPTKDSDVDLLVVMKFQGRAADQAAKIRLKSTAPFPIDILVRTPSGIRERLRMGDVFMREAVLKGVVIYEKNNAGMARKSGRRLRNHGTGIARKKKA